MSAKNSNYKFRLFMFCRSQVTLQLFGRIA